MSFGNDWSSMMIVYKAHTQELLNEAANERTAKALKNEDEPLRHWKLRINNDAKKR